MTVFIGDVVVQLLQDWIVKVSVCVHAYVYVCVCVQYWIPPLLSYTFHSARPIRGTEVSVDFQVNYEAVTLPFLREPYIYIERQTNTILLNTNIGLKVQTRCVHRPKRKDSNGHWFTVQ